MVFGNGRGGKVVDSSNLFSFFSLKVWFDCGRSIPKRGGQSDLRRWLLENFLKYFLWFGNLIGYFNYLLWLGKLIGYFDWNTNSLYHFLCRIEN